MLQRVLEPEVMDTPEEARDYDAMDHRSVNESFCHDLLAEGDIGPTVLDVGTGTALIPIALCGITPALRVVGVDLGEHMLALGATNVERAGLSGRIELRKVDAKALPYDDGAFSSAISNSIVHHIPDPRGVLREMFRVTARGGLLFVRDLARPTNQTAIDRLVERYGGDAPADPTKRGAFEHQRSLLRASLGAALTVDEVAAMAAEVGIVGCSVRMTSDRHWTLSARKP
ncbi:MAG TPA: class I SAM-dependent methyltransferase [Labilithrix sp.]|jgi:ubiquinone/menaquinone biosynthesis C-methylase UbiE|nr:class I SAM-dependent methyltransferase [Labilithrix sp.]